MRWKRRNEQGGQPAERDKEAPQAAPEKQEEKPRRPPAWLDVWPVGRLLHPGSLRELWNGYSGRRNKEKQDLDVYHVLSEGARPTADYYVLIVLSCLIASMGLIQGSVAVIIGAMIIAPLMTPILAFSLGVIWGDFTLLRISFSAIIRGALLAVAISAALSYLVPISHLSREIMSRANPSLFDIIVALGSGALAAYGYANRKVSSALTGIAIAVALMPPLCAAGIGLGKLDLRVASGASLLFAINLVSISLAAAVVFWLMKIHPLSEDRTRVTRRAVGQIVLSAALLCLITIPVAVYMHTTVELEKAQKGALRVASLSLPGSSVMSVETVHDGQADALRLTLAVDRDVGKEELQRIASTITRGSPVLARVEITCLRAVASSVP